MVSMISVEMMEPQRKKQKKKKERKKKRQNLTVRGKVGVVSITGSRARGEAWCSPQK
jgi:hypothetical protein